MRKLVAIGGAAFLAAALPVQAEVTQRGTLRVSFDGSLRPDKLPRRGGAPVAVSLTANIKTTDASIPPQLRTIAIAINRFGRLDNAGLPICRYRQIQPTSTEEAFKACRRSLVGTGVFLANVALPEQSPFPSNGKVLAFNGTHEGHPAILAHIYGTEPLPTSFVLPFVLRQERKGTYATTLTAKLPRVAAEWGFVSGLSLNLARRSRHRGKTHSYLSAGCPAPKGFSTAVFTFARASFGFEDGRTLVSTLTRRCRVGE